NELTLFRTTYSPFSQVNVRLSLSPSGKLQVPLKSSVKMTLVLPAGRVGVLRRNGVLLGASVAGAVVRAAVGELRAAVLLGTGVNAGKISSVAVGVVKKAGRTNTEPAAATQAPHRHKPRMAPTMINRFRLLRGALGAGEIVGRTTSPPQSSENQLSQRPARMICSDHHSRS